MGVRLKRIGLGVLALAAVCLVAVFAIDAHVRSSAESRIVTADETARLDGIDCIVVLGCGVRPDGQPSDMLADRIAQGVALYEKGASPKLLMSGDHSRSDYDEVNTMRNVAVEAGVPADDVFMDHAGFSTYESMHRAKSVFGADRIIVSTQRYHLYRALYAAHGLGLEAIGVAADRHTFAQQLWFDLREIPARTKDFFLAWLHTEPTFVGDPISLNQSGSVTD